MYLVLEITTQTFGIPWTYDLVREESGEYTISSFWKYGSSGANQEFFGTPNDLDYDIYIPELDQTFDIPCLMLSGGVFNTSGWNRGIGESRTQNSYNTSFYGPTDYVHNAGEILFIEPTVTYTFVASGVQTGFQAGYSQAEGFADNVSTSAYGDMPTQVFTQHEHYSYYGSAYSYVYYIPPPPLFTDNADPSVNFNALDANQADFAVSNPSAIYNAKDGADTITLPNSTTITTDQGTIPWLGTTFFFTGGAGDDKITGGTLNDKIMGGPGYDTIDGGSGFDTAGFAGSGGDFTFYLGNFLWQAAGEGGVDDLDTLANIDNFYFQGNGSQGYNTQVTSDQLFRQLVSPDEVAYLKNEIVNTTRQKTNIDALVSLTQQFVDEAGVEVTAANVEQQLHTLQTVVDTTIKFIALASGKGKALATAYEVTTFLLKDGPGLVDKTAREENFDKEYIKTFLAPYIEHVFHARKLADAIEYLFTGWSLWDAAQKVDELKAQKTEALTHLSAGLQDLYFFINKQTDIELHLRDLETELRDKYGSDHGLPKVRYYGDSDDTPNETAGLQNVSTPTVKDLGLAKLDMTTHTVTTLVSYKLVSASAGGGNAKGGSANLVLDPSTELNLTLLGFANSTATGNELNNKIVGNDGDNVLTGDLAKDRLTGGLGHDTFDFNSKIETPKGSGHDVIMDFGHLTDHIDLSDVDAKSKTKSVNDDFKFIGAQKFHHKAGELHYLKKGAYVLVEGDLDGNGKADFQIEVHGSKKLTRDDFVGVIGSSAHQLGHPHQQPHDDLGGIWDRGL